MTQRIITIDGPAGAGKTTVSRQVAKRLGWLYVDTGALYRGVAHEISRARIDWKTDESGLGAFLSGLDLSFSISGDQYSLMSSGVDISPYLRTPETTMLASKVSALPSVRQRLLSIQREIASKADAVFEGRDMGTVVFPEAPYKFFLFADLKIRARRRFDEQSGSAQDLSEVEQQIRRRDDNDSSREIAPLKPAADAIMVDSTHRSVDEVVELILETVSK